MNRNSVSVIAIAAVVAFLATTDRVTAQKPVSSGAAISETFSVEAIDHASRIVTLRDKDGLIEDVWCGPEVTRFDALKVGDKVTFTYYESLVTAIRRPGDAAKAPEAGAVSRTPGAKPGGTVARQLTAVVTIEAIDAKVPSVTVRSKDGRRMSFKLENAKNAEGYKAGDNVEVTYTQALAVSVK